ncbi:MAG: hypothetical protein OEM41_02580, partial [Ignavibacteria bacterium]|nr:hypothetical protein [Ignavibacteria bacterium]
MKANEVFDTDRGSLRVRLAAFRKFSILTPGFVLWLVVLPAWGKTGACAQQREGFVGYAWGTGFTRMAAEFDLTPTFENGHTLQYSTT